MLAEPAEQQDGTGNHQCVVVFAKQDGSLRLDAARQKADGKGQRHTHDDTPAAMAHPPVGQCVVLKILTYQVGGDEVGQSFAAHVVGQRVTQHGRRHDEEKQQYAQQPLHLSACQSGDGAVKEGRQAEDDNIARQKPPVARRDGSQCMIEVPAARRRPSYPL